jgi:phospholipid transport system substrate-binding protein
MVAFLLAALIALSPGALLADPAAEAEQLVRDNASKVLTILNENKGNLENNPKLIYTLVDEIIEPNVDYDSMAKLILKKYWRTATPEQRQRFIKEFKGMLIRTYTRSLNEYAGNTEIIFLKSVSKKEGKYVTVYSEIVQSGKPNIPVNYSLIRKDDGYKIYDVVIEGLSLVKNYHTSFGPKIEQIGLDGLIDDLAGKNARGDDGSA